ncbi:MAG: nitroreductase family protein [Pseudomonadota bacterium]
MASVKQKTVQDALIDRFGDDAPRTGPDLENEMVASMACRGSCRAFTEQPVSDQLIKGLCATAFSSPTKSDLQQRDIVVLRSEEQRRALDGLVAGQAWVADAPMILIFCGNNRRQRLLHEWHDVPYANDHLDAVFNAVADAAIALGAFVTAAEAVGLGCCPISAVRNEAEAVSDLLGLPDHVFPLAGLAVGYPEDTPQISMRLPLHVTYHEDVYMEDDLQQTIAEYDARRRAKQPYAAQRFTQAFGETPDYGWSEDKVRQYSQPERADFGTFIRKKGFRLE